jgi:sulfate transport system ATP-binding protein
MSIQVNHISKSFGETAVLKDVNLEVQSGELIALLGPSGSGKTTLLRIIAGMETADSGSVLLNGEETQGTKAGQRRVGFVFQHYALFKHMTVFENVAFGLRVRPRRERASGAEIQRKVMQLLALVHLDHYHDRYPSQLSGGQRQRVALARALAVEPKVLLLDEPFGALDAKVRKELRRWMRRLHDEIHITSIFVTHDQEEAMEVADRVVVMSNGRIEQTGTPGEVYHSPVNSFVYDFLGNYNVFEGWKDDEGNSHLLEYEAKADDAAPAVTTAMSGPGKWISRYPEIAGMIGKFIPAIIPGKTSGSTPSKHKTRTPQYHKPVKLFARPHELFLSRTQDNNDYVSAQIIHINPAGPLVKIELERRNGYVLTAEVSKEVIDMLALKKGEQIYVRPKSTRVFEDT